MASVESREAGREYRDRNFVFAARNALNTLVEDAQEEILNDLQDKIHLLSVGASFIPIAGTAVSIGLDALNVAISLARGNTDEAKLYTLFAIPIIGDIAGVGALLYVGGAYANRFYDYFFGTPDPELPPEFLDIIYHVEWVSGGANNSFAAGTGVVTGVDEEGNYITTNIEDLEVGDIVLAADEFNPDGTPKYTIVTDVRSTTVYEQTVVTYTDENGNVETLKTTQGHEFFVEGLGWVTAGELVAGQELQLPDGSTATVTSVETEAIPEGLTVYNLTVSDGATYYVDEGEGNVSPVLVHNAGLGKSILRLLKSGKLKKGVLGKYQVGFYKRLRKGAQKGLDAHHVGQQALMKKFISNYNPKAAPSILVPKIGHTIRGSKGIVSRNTKGFKNARDVLSRDIKELRRVYPDISNKILKKLIKLNKRLYSELRK